MFNVDRALPQVRDLYNLMGSEATFAVCRLASALRRGAFVEQQPLPRRRYSRPAQLAMACYLCGLSAVAAASTTPITPAITPAATPAPAAAVPVVSGVNKPVTAVAPTLLQRPLTAEEAPNWLTSQLWWQASPEHAFIVRVEPNAAFFAASSHWTSAILDAQAFDLRIYHANPATPTVIGDLALEVPHSGHAMTMYHTGQADAPLMVITQTNGRLYNIYGFHLGQNAQGHPQVVNSLQRSSAANPEIIIHRQRGMFLLVTEPLQDNITITRVRYENGQWHTLSPTTAGHNRLRKLAPLTED